LAAADIYVAYSGSRKIYRDVASLPDVQAVLVLGASVYSSGQMGDILRDRAATALEVYDSGKDEKDIVSGYRTDNYDEVEAAKIFLEKEYRQGTFFWIMWVLTSYESLYHAKYFLR